MSSMSSMSRARARVKSAVLRRLGAPLPPQGPTEVRPTADELRYRRIYWRVGRRLLGDELPADVTEVTFAPETGRRIVEAVGRTHGLATFADELSRGASFEKAHVATVRALVDTKQRHTARAITLALADIPSGQQARLLGLGLVTHGMALFELAWEQFRGLPAAVLAEHVPVEAVEGALKTGTPEAVAVAREVGASFDLLSTPDLIELAGRFLSTDHVDLARDQIDEAERRGVDELDDVTRSKIANIKRWTHPAEPTPYPQGSINIGVIDYHQPDYDRASRNVGDYVQTLAMLGNLARFQGLRFSGDQGLGELATLLQGRVRPELREVTGSADVHLLPVSRDFSAGDPIPENTWMIAFGWHMHSMYRLRFGLPYHPNINPLFVSFHINRVQVLDDPTIAYLKEHGPIGCRDWTTVDLLLSAGVDAFFTGCLTTTVNTVFRPIDAVDRSGAGSVGIIDLPPTVGLQLPRPVERMTNADRKYRDMNLVEGTYAAIDILEDYQRRMYRLITSRLHAYLPATTLGLDVEFRPHVPGDVRFDGLLGMKPDAPALDEMRDGIRALIHEVFGLVVDGTAKDEVYAHWRKLTADKVAEAKARHQAPPSESPIELDLPAVFSQIRAGVRRYGPHDDAPADVTDVAMSLDANFKGLLPTTAESLLTNASGPVRLWITTRGLDERYYEWFASTHPGVPITFLNFDGVEYGEITRMIKHISITTMDRLLLPDVLDHLDRITYVDIDTVTEGDVCELAAVDLDGYPLAARSPTPNNASMVWRNAGNLLPPEAAAELRRTMSARHPFDFSTFNAGVLVLDLARMRSDRFAENFLPMAGRYGLNDQDILIAYVGADRVELDPKWNALPVQEIVREPGIVHYAGAGKPWGDELVPYGEHWKAWEQRAADRVGRPPA